MGTPRAQMTSPKKAGAYSPLAPFEHLESLAEQSEIVDFQKLCKTLAKPQPAGSVLHFRLQTKDSVFAEKTVGGDRWTVIVRGLTIDHTVDGIVTDLGNGQYDVSIQVTKAAKYQIDILLSKCIVSSLISNSISSQLCPPVALHLTIEPGPVSVPHSELVYDGPKSKIFDIAPIAGRSGYFLVRAKDQYGNATSLGLNETLEATCSDKNLKIVTQDMYDAGVYKVTYCTDKAASYKVDVHLVNSTAGTKVLLNGSPLAVTVLPDKPCQEQCTFVDCKQYSAGQKGAYAIHVYDQYKNPISDAQILVQTDSEAISWRGTKNLKDEGKPGCYEIAFYTEKCAQHKLKAFVVSNAEIQYPTPFEFEEYVLVPLPGQVTVEHCFSNNEQLRGTAGVEGAITLYKRDRFSNLITEEAGNDATFAISCDDPNMHVQPAVKGHDAAYLIKYMAEKAKTYTLRMSLGDQELEGGPFTLLIEPQRPSASNTFIELPIAYAWVGQPSMITVLLQDQFGNLTSAQDPANPIQMLVSEEEGPLSITFAEPERFEPCGSTGVAISSNVPPHEGMTLPQLLNNDKPSDDGPILSFNIPPPPYVKPNPLILHSNTTEEPVAPVLAPTQSWLKFACDNSPTAFVKCRVLSTSEAQKSSLWSVEYSDNGTSWVESAKLLQVSGWSLAEWQYCGEHPFWRLSCTNPHANSEVFPPEAETVPDGVTRCPCPGAHQKPDPSEWISVEWYVPSVGKAYASYTKEQTKIYDVSMQIGAQTLAQCAEGPFPLWVCNTTAPAKCSVELPDTPDKLVVRKDMQIAISLRDKFGFQRLAGSDHELKQLHVKIKDPAGKPVTAELANHNDGTYTATFDGCMAGTYHLEVKFAHEAIPAPSEFTMIPAPTDSKNCVFLGINGNYEEIKRLQDRTRELRALYEREEAERLGTEVGVTEPVGVDPADIEHAELDLDKKYADGLQGGVVGQKFRFRILARDEFYNHCNVPQAGQFQVTVTPVEFPKGFEETVPPTNAEVVYEKDGYYGVWYTVLKAGKYALDIHLKRDEQLVHMKQFEVSMASSVVHAESCKLLSNSHPGEGQPCRSGEALEMLFSVRDQYGNPILHSEEANKNFTGWFDTPWASAQTGDVSDQQTTSQDAADKPPAEGVDPTNVWEPVMHQPTVEIAPAADQAEGVYKVVCTAYTMGAYVVHLMFGDTEVSLYPFEVVPTEAVAAKCKVISLAEELSTCYECDRRTAMYFSRQGNQAYCDPCWTVHHQNKHRVAHQRTVIGVDNKRRRAGETLTFGILTRDAFDNNVVVENGASDTLQVMIEYREYQQEPKARKDGKGKKKAQVIPCQIKNLQGLMYAMDFLASDTVASVKRKVWEKDGLPSNVQKLVCEGQAMDDAKTLADYHLVKGSVIDVELCDESHKFKAQCTNKGQGTWQVNFEVLGNGQYSVVLEINGKQQKDLHRFILEAPAEESKGKGSQTKLLEDTARELDNLKGQWALLNPSGSGDDLERLMA